MDSEGRRSVSLIADSVASNPSTHSALSPQSLEAVEFDDLIKVRFELDRLT